MNTKKLFISVVSALVFAAQFAFAAGTPEDVTGLDATAIDTHSIGLTWDTAKDGGGGNVDHYRIYYGTFSVFEAGEGEYDSSTDTPGNTTSYVVDELDPNTPYYFSVTAISSDDLESGQYSLEASATTMAEEGGEAPEGTDTTSPTVTSVAAPDKMHVKIVFSEPVQLPAESPEMAFGIVEQINPANSLEVMGAVMDAMDATSKTVLLEVAEQSVNVNYIVTAGVLIKDLAGNPIVSGSTDSGLFLGSANEPPAMEENEEPVIEEETPAEEPVIEEETPAVEEAVSTPEAEDCDDMDCFLAHMTEGTPATVMESDNNYTYKLTITGTDGNNVVVNYSAKKHSSVLFSSTEMECKVAKGSYADANAYRKVFSLDNCSGDLVTGYEAVKLADTTPPENVTNLILTFREQLEQFAIVLRWTPSLNTAKDLVDQMLYMSMDRGSTYDSGKSLGDSATTTEVASLEGGKEYTFKVTTKDASGNESTGAVKSIRLPQTGMGVGLALMLSVLGANKVLRRKKDDHRI